MVALRRTASQVSTASSGAALIAAAEQFESSLQLFLGNMVLADRVCVALYRCCDAR